MLPRNVTSLSSPSVPGWCAVTSCSTPPSAPGYGTALGGLALSVAKHCSSLIVPPLIQRWAGISGSQFSPWGIAPSSQLIFFTLTQNRALLPGSFTAAQSRAFLYFSPCKLEMIGTPLPFNQTPLLPLQPPAGFCFLPKNSLYHSLPLVKCPIDFLYILAAAGRDRLFNNPGLDEAAGIGLPHFCLRFLVQKYARVPEVPYFLSASRPLLACVDDNTAPPERVQQLESVRLQSWDTYTYLSFIRIYGNLTTVSFRSEQDMNSPRCLKDDKVIFFSPQAEENKHIVWQMQALLQSLLELL